jgi:dihydrofolate reductase
VVPRFTLTVVTGVDGRIAPPWGEIPAAWASPEEQALFRADVAAADWAVMGRRTHAAADRPDRRRIVFSTSGGAGVWRRPTQLWLDPDDLTPDELARAVARVRRLERGLILGGTRVHDWFRDRHAIDRVHLTVEPVRFGGGPAIFTDQATDDPLGAFLACGFRPVSERRLNARGTRFLVLAPTDG